MKKIILVILCITVIGNQLLGNSTISSKNRSIRRTISEFIISHKSLIALGGLVCTIGLFVFKNRQSKKKDNILPDTLQNKRNKTFEEQTEQTGPKKVRWTLIREDRERSDQFIKKILAEGEKEKAEQEHICQILGVDSVDDFFGILGLTTEASITDIERKSQLLLDKWKTDAEVTKTIKMATHKCRYIKQRQMDQRTRESKNDEVKLA